ncbi:Lrp/AsnC family transcriptional regulator [Leptolyngbya ohadii]|uniref:Lrp/AsnC family transcriptional regulator n=1 Tax=Leptolyngbya ohadii TaxID=1962290 RepID=UPI000B59F86D|nr:Lrp/AsnC family transcriptional regulator [Leptolyngbya ohadii]
MTQTPSLLEVVPLDEVDQDIIDLLKEDGRKPFTDIAKQLSLPESTVRYRVQRLLQSNVLQIRAQLNPRKLGIPHIMTMRLNVACDRIDAVAEALSEMPEVQFVAIVTGQYNIIMDACFGTHEDLLSLFERIQRIQGIIHYDSCMVLKLLKSEYQYSFPEHS